MTALTSVFSFAITVTFLVTVLFVTPASHAATLTDAIINEFVADNGDGIKDEDGDREDWIEIWNTSGVAGDLGGWFLTDDPLDLRKWALPAIEMTSGGYLVVFASGKDRADAAGEPHTNFGLQQEAGGYLALVRPDGVTIASEFTDYPEQFEDIAYGVGIEGETPVTFFSAGAPAKWHVPTGPVANWTDTDFDDSAWNAGATGIGYDSPGGDYEPLLGAGGNVRSEMLSQNASVYIRIPFEVADPTGISQLNMRLKWEDGFVAHLNGTEFHKESAPANPQWDSEATNSRSDEDDAVTFFDYPVNEGGLVAGTNVLSIQGLNVGPGSSDLLFVPEFEGIFKDTNNLVDGYFVDPTPDAVNGERVDGIVEDTKFSVDRGFYDAPVDVAITTNVADAEIRFTTDGTPPSETEGTLYTGPIRISETTVLRAIGYKSGFRSTSVDTHTYIFATDVYPDLVDGLKAVPTISLVTENATFLNPNAGNDYNEHKSSIEMIYPDASPGFQEDAGLTNFGGRFTNFDKKSFRLYFRKEYGAGKLRHPIFDGHDYKNFQPAEEFDAINLRSGSHDMTNRGAYMGPRFADDSMLDMGQIAPHGRFVHLYLNGQYWGQYHLRERWNADMASSYFGGEKEDYDAISANNQGEQFLGGTVYDGTADFWNETRNLINGADPFVNAADHLDITNLIDFMLLWTSGECESEFRAFGSQSRGVPFKFMVRDPDGFMPNGGWNHDHAVTHNGPLNAMTRLRSEGDPDYEILVADRIHKHFFNDGALSVEESVERLRKRYEEMKPGFSAEARRWGYQTVASWENYVNSWLNTGLPQRTPSMIQRLKQAGMYPDVIAPVFSQHGGSLPLGGSVTMTTNATAIYYTLNGFDPRLPGGGINPNATQAVFADGVREPEEFVDAGAVWKYLDDGSDQGVAWRAADYDDSAWKSGPAQLGYGENATSSTVIGFVDTDPDRGGTQKNATTYFRKEVTISEPSDFTSFVLRIRYDDGAAVFVNGAEVARTDNLPADADSTTFATSATPDEDEYFEYSVPSSRFVDGVNTIAVEVHNQSAGSSDMRFDFSLGGLVDLTNGNNVTEPIGIAGATSFLARGFDSGSNEWSALTSVFFSLNTVPADATNLVVSEVHYRPADPTSPEELAISADRDDYEFIELLNTANQPIDLSGVYFGQGIEFYFAENTILESGQRVVLVKDLEAFTTRYGELAEGWIAGEYSGRLSNDGEQISLLTTGNTVLLDFVYNDQAPWPVDADGAGYSMILTGVDPAIGGDWSAHALIGGNPGGADSSLLTGYDLWKLANGITDDQSDDDGDGITAFAEYAMGTDPAVANELPATLGGLVSFDSNGYLAITYQRNLNATDVTFQIQDSLDLKTWRDVTDLELVSEETNEVEQTSRVTERLSEPVTSENQRFLRVRMTR